MSTTQATLDLIKASRQNPIAGELAKAWTQSSSAVSGITYYDLEGPAKQLYPVLTPLRNMLPRRTGGAGIQANWRAVTGVNVTGLSIGLGQGNRGGVQASSTQDFFAAFKSLGLDDYVTFEADLAAQEFEDLKALAVEGLLRATMLGEEKLTLGGNSGLALGTTPTPTLSAASTGGSLATGTLSVIAVALTPDGYSNASIAGGVNGQVTRTNADGSTDTYGGGSAKQSANATVAVTGPAGSVSASVAAVTGAAGYAWYWGAAGSEKLGAITTINSVAITANAAGAQLASAITNAGSDNSANSLVYDGFLTIAANPSSNAYAISMATGTAGTGTPLTADGEGGIVEIDAALKYFWDERRLSPDAIYVSSQEQKNITAKILQGNANTAQRFVVNAEQGALAGGFMVRSYLNKYSMAGAKEIPIVIHPNMPPGTILFFTEKLPYPLSNVAAINQMRLRRDYYQIEWPLRSRKYEYGVYFDGVLQCYAPFSLGVISNIGNG